MRIVPVLLSGGIGTRLWPLSTARLPKQLQPLVGSETMIQATSLRLASMTEVVEPIVVCGADHAVEIRRQLRDVGIEPLAVIAEPAGRNTAPAVLIAALMAPEDAVLIVLPSDHVIADGVAFGRAVQDAVASAVDGHLVTFGIVPDRPETGYGYIEVAERSSDRVLPVEAFVEKPDLETAAQLVVGGRHYWNSGMFAFTPEAVIGEFEQHAPDVMRDVKAATETGTTEDGIFAPDASFAETRSVSFDHAVMEFTERAAVVPLMAGWSDVGSWSTLWEIGDSDDDGNVIRGDVIAVDVGDSLIRAESRTVAVIGVSDLVVIETDESVLVVPRERAQDVKRVWEILSERQGS